MKTVIKRLNSKTPAFFKKVRNIGLGLTALSATILAQPIVLPAIIMKLAGYLTVAGVVMTSVSQTAVKNDAE